MKEVSRRGILGFAGLAGLCGLARGAARTLFNGRDFQGWKEEGIGLWSVEDGVMVCRSHPEKGGPGYLFTAEEYGDFTLELEFWVSRGGNSGIFIRQPLRTFGTRGDARPGQRPGDGVEVQIDYNDPKNLTGSIYNKKQPSKVVGGEERWNRYRIVCRGPRVTVFVDDTQVNEWEGLPAARGAIALQQHGARPHDHVVKFRNIRITTM